MLVATAEAWAFVTVELVMMAASPIALPDVRRRRRTNRNLKASVPPDPVSDIWTIVGPSVALLGLVDRRRLLLVRLADDGYLAEMGHGSKTSRRLPSASDLFMTAFFAICLNDMSLILETKALHFYRSVQAQGQSSTILPETRTFRPYSLRIRNVNTRCVGSIGPRTRPPSYRPSEASIWFLLLLFP